MDLEMLPCSDLGKKEEDKLLEELIPVARFIKASDNFDK
jgi:hypothetical protein